MWGPRADLPQGLTSFQAARGRGGARGELQKAGLLCDSLGPGHRAPREATGHCLGSLDGQKTETQPTCRTARPEGSEAIILPGKPAPHWNPVSTAGLAYLQSQRAECLEGRSRSADQYLHEWWLHSQCEDSWPGRDSCGAGPGPLSVIRDILHSIGGHRVETEDKQAIGTDSKTCRPGRCRYNFQIPVRSLVFVFGVLFVCLSF